jgi:hypothetical protein
MGEEFFKLFNITKELTIFANENKFSVKNTYLKEYILKNCDIKTSNRKKYHKSLNDFKVAEKISILTGSF